MLVVQMVMPIRVSELSDSSFKLYQFFDLLQVGTSCKKLDQRYLLFVNFQSALHIVHMIVHARFCHLGAMIRYILLSLHIQEKKIQGKLFEAF